MLSNVIGNAIKFSPPESTVTVGIDHDDQAAHIFVRDCGPGIARGDLHRVFERHWHAKSSAGGGFGLGLFIAKGIMEAHGGAIWVESRVGSGSTFHVRLPVYPVGAQGALTSQVLDGPP